MTAFLYRIHQRVLASDRAVSFLPPLESAASPDMTLSLTPRAEPPGSGTVWYRSDDSAEATAIERNAEGFIIRFADRSSFHVDEGGRSIQLLHAPPAYTDGDLAAYALGPVLAIALHLQGSVLLHAGAVMLRDKAVLIAGAGGSGKSTTVAMLEREGCTILGDDLTEVSAVPPHRALPSSPALRLWTDSIEALYGDAGAFPDRAPSWNKKIVRVEEREASAVIAALLFLDGVRGAARLERLAPKAAWSRLMADAFTARLPDPAMSRRIFDVMASLADRVAAYALTPPPLEDASGFRAWLEEQLAEPLR
jgi:hypothetical protein